MAHNRKQRTFVRVSIKYRLGFVVLTHPQIAAIQSEYLSKVRNQSNLLSAYTKGKIFCGVSNESESTELRIEKYKKYIESVYFYFPCTINTLCPNCYSRCFNGKLNLLTRRRQYSCINTDYINKQLLYNLKLINATN